MQRPMNTGVQCNRWSIMQRCFTRPCGTEHSALHMIRRRNQLTCQAAWVFPMEWLHLRRGEACARSRFCRTAPLVGAWCCWAARAPCGRSLAGGPAELTAKATARAAKGHLKENLKMCASRQIGGVRPLAGAVGKIPCPLCWIFSVCLPRLDSS